MSDHEIDLPDEMHFGQHQARKRKIEEDEIYVVDDSDSNDDNIENDLSYGITARLREMKNKKKKMQHAKLTTTTIMKIIYQMGLLLKFVKINLLIP